MTNIEWCDITANPIHLIREDGSNGGHFCQKLSPGCLNCYAEEINQSNYFGFASHLPYSGKPPENLIFDDEVMRKLVNMRSSKTIFLCSMTDLFGNWIPSEWIYKAFAYMAIASQHKFLVLTKRPERMKDILRCGGKQRIRRDAVDVGRSMGLEPRRYESFETCDFDWPLANVGLGTSIENQQVAGDRATDLLDCPAAMRFLSCEPLLEELNLVSYKRNGGSYNYLLNTWEPHKSGAGGAVAGGRISPFYNDGINWIICGGESGSGVRPCHIDWIRSLVQQCQQTKTAVFVKQWGSHAINSTPYIDGVVQSHFRVKLKSRKGGDISEFPADLQIRQFPHFLGK
jgi:protein gp37